MPVSFSWTVTSPAPAGSSSAALDLAASSPIDMALDPLTGDLADLDGDGQQPWLYGIDGIASDLVSRVQARGLSKPPDGPEIPGEWYLDIELGLPLFETLFRRGASQQDIREMYRKCALGTPGIAEVLRLEGSLTDREQTVTLGARADTGEFFDVELTQTQGG